MNTNKEIEYKILLDEKTFSNILSAYPDHKSYTQINYYLTSKELQEKKYALRVREKEGRYELTLKIPQGFAKMEYNLKSVKEFGFFKDIGVLFKTVAAVF